MAEGQDPDDGDRSDAEDDGGGRAVTPSGRVTLDFSGPPLSLPEESDDGASAEGGTPEPASDAPLELDTSEFRLPEARVDVTEDEEAEAGPLELDTSELDDAPAHDAWTTDHIRRRSTPPPIASVPVGHEEPAAPRATPERDDGRPSQPSPQSDAGDALGLVDRQQRPSGEVDLASEMADRYALGDFTGALRAAELLLGREPEHPAAQRYAQSSRERLEQLYSSRLGSLESVPEVAVPDEEVRWLGLDHRAGFLVSRIDGAVTVEQLVDVSGMARLEALKTLVELLDRGVIRL